MTHYVIEWQTSILEICADVGIVLPAEDVILGHRLYQTKGDICKQILGDKLEFDYALPQGMVDQYKEDCDYDIRQWFVMAYPKAKGYAVGILFPLTYDAMQTLHQLHIEAEEAGWVA